MRTERHSAFNFLMQVGLMGFTLMGFLLIALKLPQYGLILNLISQIFWFYSSYKAWREAHQIGILVITVITTFIYVYGIINYWFIP